MVGRFCPLCVVSHLSPPLVLSPPCSSKSGAIPPTLRTTDLKFLMTKRLRKIIKICLLINICNNYRLYLCGRLHEKFPAWFCSHLLAMIQACPYHSAIIVKSQQWPTPSESIAIYCVKETSFVCDTSFTDYFYSWCGITHVCSQSIQHLDCTFKS